GPGLGTTRDLREARHARESCAQRPLAAVVSPLGAFGGKTTREHHIRVRSQQSERLQLLALSPPIKELEGANHPWRTPTSQKKASPGNVAKLPYTFSYLTAAFEASPAQAITNCDKPT